MSTKLYTLTITGGPCGRKTTIMETLRERYGDRFLVMPEIPTILLTNGSQRPRIEVPFSDAWFRSSQ
jgi:predicted ATPase